MFFKTNLDAFLALAGELRLKGLSGGGAEAEKEQVDEITQEQSFKPKKENRSQFRAPISNFEEQSSKGSFDTTVALRNEKINAELQDLDEQIKSMITKSEISAGPGKGKMASCNACGKQGPFRAMPQHIEANHIAGGSHACNICEKISRSRDGLRNHKFKEHRAIKA